MQFMDIPEKYSKSSAPVYILPIVYEGMISWGPSDNHAAEEIITASKLLEFYDEEFDTQACYDGIYTLEPLNFNNKSSEEAVFMLADELKHYPSKFVITIGADQGIGVGCIKAIEKPYSVLQCSAHPNLFPSWEGDEYDERCFGYHASNKAEKLVQVGIRAMEHDEKSIIDEEENILAIRPQEIKNMQEITKKILNHLTQNVFIELDVSVFDPSIIKNTEPAVPNGLQWQQLINILKEVFKHKSVKGVHVCGFYPEENYNAESFALAELIYKIICMNKVYTKA